MINKILNTTVFVLACQMVFGQTGGNEWVIESTAERPITPSYKISESPAVVDTVIPIPDLNYPLLVRNMDTEIHLKEIDASKIKIRDKLDQLYPGYVKAGFGMYTSPLAEFYYNSTRNRRSNLGVHLKHNSSWGNLENFAPSTYDMTTAKLFGEWFTTNFNIEAELDYINNGYNFYGITDTTDFFDTDTLRNRVQGFGGMFSFGNFERQDSAKLMWRGHVGNQYFHEFERYWDVDGDNHARNNNFIIGGDFRYRQGMNTYNLDFDWAYNRYWFNELPDSVNQIYNDRNALITVRPVITTQGDKWKVVYGLDLNFDFPEKTLDKIFKVVPVVEARYSLFNDMMIPYIGIDGGVNQNSFYTLNRMNPYIYSGQEIRNETEYDFYAGIKGSLSKKITFNVAGHYRDLNNTPLFKNEQTHSDLNRFDVSYVDMRAAGVEGSITYQSGEKLKVDLIAEYNNYKLDTMNSYNKEVQAWHLPTIKGTIRGSYNMFDKIYAKADFSMEYGRRSPVYQYNGGNDYIPVEMPLIADANLEVEYRYSPRFSAFLQLNNLANQKYDRWYQYRVQGFQVLGGVTFGF